MDLAYPISTLAAEIKAGSGEQYLNRLVADVSEVLIQCGTLPLRQARANTHHLSMCLHYHDEPEAVFEQLCLYLREWASGPASGERARRVDCALALAFDIYPGAAPRGFALGSVFVWCRVNALALPVLFHSMRKSFAKALALMDFHPDLRALVLVSDDADAQALCVVEQVRLAHQLEDGGAALVALLRALPPGKLKLAAKDLRRAPVAASTCAPVSLSTLQSLCDGEPVLTFSRLVILNYAGLLGLQGLGALYRQFNGTPFVSKLSVLAAQQGYDRVFMQSVNQALMAEGAGYVVPAPSASGDIRDYFEGCLTFWARERALANYPSSALPMVSVLFSTHNPDLRLLRSSLRSIVMQSYPRLEVVFVDDCSAPEQAAALEQCVREECFLASRPLVFRRNEENQGQYNNRNLGIGLASGEYIAIQDDDDLSHPDRIRIQVDRMLGDPAVVASRVKHLRLSASARVMLDGDEPDQIFGDAPPSFIWRRDVFERIGLFLPTSTRGDIEFYQRLIRYYGRKVVVSVPAPLLLMRGAFETVSASKEYHHKVALEALRFMYNNGHIAEAVEMGVAPEAWVPRLFKIKTRSADVG